MAALLTSNGACGATGGRWFAGVVAPAIGTCESAWHFRHCAEVSLGVVNVKSDTATWSGAIAGCAWQVVQSICVGSVELVWQLVQPMLPATCTAGAPSACIWPAAMGNEGWLKLVTIPPLAWQPRQVAVVAGSVLRSTK